MKIYQDDGYVNFKEIASSPMPFIFIVGARGVGKTYGALDYVLSNNIKFIYMRRTNKQVQAIKSPLLNPFKSLENDNRHYIMQTVTEDINGVYNAVANADGILEATGPMLGYILALSTVANIRGFDASDVDWLIYDEFIKEKHEKPISNEGTAFLNAIETIARNRELKGAKPLKVILLSNSNDLANPLFMELELVRVAEKMIDKSEAFKRLPERGLDMYILDKSPISEKKKKTALYKLAGTESDFSRMALANKFSKDYRALVKSLSLKEYKPLVSVGEMVIYKHKSDNTYYICEHLSGNPEHYDGSEIELKRFTKDYYFLNFAYLSRKIYFESYMLQAMFEKCFKL